MIRTVLGGLVGGFAGVLLLAAYGAADGYANGVPTRRDLAPGLEAAAVGGLSWGVFLGWMGAAAGGTLGGLAGLGSAAASAFARRPARA